MAAPDKSGVTYFKVGRTTDVAKRVCAVQTGCPLKITMAWVITVWDNRSSLGLEQTMHRMLSDYHSHGEWFAMCPEKPLHKQVMNDAFAKAVEFASQGGVVKWRKMDISELRAAMSAQAAEAASEARDREIKIRGKVQAMMALTGRRIL